MRFVIWHGFVGRMFGSYNRINNKMLGKSLKNIIYEIVM